MQQYLNDTEASIKQAKTDYLYAIYTHFQEVYDALGDEPMMKNYQNKLASISG